MSSCSTNTDSVDSTNAQQVNKNTEAKGVATNKSAQDYPTIKMGANA
ncbi:peptidylprolyl isomerase, partial [Francisella tularensis subsp. holarctica]|nr:peptidylprolyl isomerase [Francisella tularensis subsp. holarctica]